jgi:hypothetical protein
MSRLLHELTVRPRINSGMGRVAQPFGLADINNKVGDVGAIKSRSPDRPDPNRES